MAKMEFAKYLAGESHCGCGRKHSCGIDRVVVERDALVRLPEILSLYSYRHICLIDDVHTREAAGKKLCGLLDGVGYEYEEITFPDAFLIPDEAALGRIMMEINRECDLILAVGSGTLNDICKFISYQLGKDYFIIATAPSMDGFASNVAPLITNQTKITYEVSVPKVIIGDLGILAAAPMDMIAAGVGDMLGKHLCLMDWKLSHMVNGEYYCDYAAGLVQESIDKIMSCLDGLESRDEDAVQSLMEGLVLSGIVMSYIGNSRPASGSEHHLSHYWEMMALLNNGHMELHGTKVAVGTIIGLKMYELFGRMDFGKCSVGKPFCMEAWQKEIRRVYGGAADSVIALENQCEKNADAYVKQRRKSMEENLENILAASSKLPPAEEIKQILKSLGAKYMAKQVGVDEAVLKDSIFYAKELRNRYGILQVWFDYDCQDWVAGEIKDYFAGMLY